MEIYKDVPKRFLPNFERHEPIIQDHTATQEYRRCPREYFYSTVLQMKERDTPVHLNWGSAYHKFREILELEYFKLESKDKKSDSALTMCGVTALTQGVEYWKKLQPKDPMPESKWGFMTEARLIESFKYVLNQWRKEKHQGMIEVIATEQPLNIAIQHPDGSISVTGGRADQIVRVGGQMWGRDFKTTSRPLDWYDKKNDPNEQFTRYTYMESKVNGERVQGQLIEVLFNAAGGKTARSKAPTGPELRTFTVSYTQGQLEEWERDQHYWDAQMRYSRENDHYPKSYATCTQWCKFAEVCKSPNERSIELKLRSSFVFRPWNHQEPDE